MTSSLLISTRVAPAHSANMNANEVLANIALEMSGHKKGEYQYIEPHDDLNMGQSTNDVYPTAIQDCLIIAQSQTGSRGRSVIRSHFIKKEMNSIILLKMGRTEGQDAVPMTARPGVSRFWQPA